MIHIAHRGAPLISGEPPNSRAAFAAAKAQGFTHVETDLRLAADGQIVLAHDAEDRVAAEPLHAAWPVLRQFAWINLELKEAAVVEPLCRFLAREATEASLFQRIVISSFAAEMLILMHELLPEIKLAALLYPWQEELNLPLSVRPASIHLTKEFAAAHPQRPPSLGIEPAMVFTVNDLEWRERLPPWVSGIFTDTLLPNFSKKS